MEAINYLRSRKDIIITKANKGGKTVLLDKSTYIQKINDLLKDSSTYEKVNSDPLKKWQSKFNKQLKTILKNSDLICRHYL